ncbi:trypsin-like serine peptidase [Streptosporangium sandarakinum]|uniref:trypsin-like serine peptidase n=1 Tax=Streptosporangium sandarakinum TaxID=1260955 RepID=UPI0033B5952A
MSPRVRRLTATLGALFAACVTLVSAFAGSAGADAVAAPWSGTPNGITSVTLTKTDADMKRIVEYWSPARLKAAQNNTPAAPEVKPSGGATSSASASPTTSAKPSATATAAGGMPIPAGGAVIPAAGTSSGSAKTAKVTSSPVVSPTFPKKKAQTGGNPITVGKVFFRIGDKDYWCSASSVAAANHRLVATAAHCTYDAKQDRFAEYWIFIPGYADGGTPYGIYVGHTLNLHSSFIAQGDYDYDYAFITVHDGFRWKPGRTAGSYVMEDVGALEDNVGGQGLMVNRGISLSTFAFGYPAAPQIDGSRPYDGRTMKRCDGRTYRANAPARLVDRGIALRCGFTAGASGGPWLIYYDPANGVGYLNGVNSFAWDTDTDKKYDRISSPYFMASTYVVYRWAAQQTAS